MGILTGGKWHLGNTQITKNAHFSSVFASFVATVAMATTETTKSTYEWTPTVESFNMIPCLPWSDTDLIMWDIMQINIQKSAKITQKCQFPAEPTTCRL